MSIKIPCPQCAAVYHVDERKLGQVGRCKKCGAKFDLIPGTRVGEQFSATEFTSPAVPPSQEDLPSPFGKYKIDRLLGSGGMGAVYLAQDLTLERWVALKVPHRQFAQDAEIRARFLREARAAARFHHPNFCPIYEIGEFQGYLYLTMPFIEGGTLSSQIQRNQPGNPKKVAELVRQLAAALAVAHGQGIVHRDLKPANVMIDARGTLIIMDFGLARSLHRDDPTLTVAGAPVGTPAYMPPEQAEGNLEAIGKHSDIYTLGVIFYELLTGRRPFEGAPLYVMAMIVSIDPPAPSDHHKEIDPRLEQICLKAMAKKPEARHPSMDEFARALQGWLESPARVPLRPPPPIPPPRDRPLPPPPRPRDRQPLPPLPRPDPPRKPPSRPDPAPIARKEPAGPRPPQARTRPAPRPPEPVIPARTPADPLASLALILVGSIGILLASVLIPRDEPPGAEKPIKPTPPSRFSAPARPVDREAVNSIGMKFRLIPAGEFLMGAPDPEPRASSAEKPQHRVRITQAFFLGAFEVTQADFRRVMGVNPSAFSDSGSRKFEVVGLDTSRHPVESVTWVAAITFCNSLSRLEGLTPAHRADGTLIPGADGYRLPTEAEWEYACRGQTTTPFSFGERVDSTQINFDGEVSYNGSATGRYLKRTTPVGSYPPNRLGLFDMHGNVREWCADHAGRVYTSATIENPSGPSTGTDRVTRGGDWSDTPVSCRSAARLQASALVGRDYCGFRVARGGPMPATSR